MDIQGSDLEAMHLKSDDEDEKEFEFLCDKQEPFMLSH